MAEAKPAKKPRLDGESAANLTNPHAAAGRGRGGSALPPWERHVRVQPLARFSYGDAEDVVGERAGGGFLITCGFSEELFAMDSLLYCRYAFVR